MLMPEPQQLAVGERRQLKLVLKTDAPLGMIASSLRKGGRIIFVGADDDDLLRLAFDDLADRPGHVRADQGEVVDPPPVGRALGSHGSRLRGR